MADPSSAINEALERREAFRWETLQAWHEYQASGRHVTAEQADAWLELLEQGCDVEPPTGEA